MSYTSILFYRYFDIAIKAFLTCILRYNKKGGGVLGSLTGYYGCVEEQGRGMCVCVYTHMNCMTFIFLVFVL